MRKMPRRMVFISGIPEPGGGRGREGGREGGREEERGREGEREGGKRKKTQELDPHS